MLIDAAAGNLWTAAAVTATALAFGTALLTSMLAKNKFPVEGKNAIICGGSQGLGLAVAHLLLSRGANVAIVGRSQSKLDAAVAELQARCSGTKQKLHAISADLTSSQDTETAFDKFTELMGVGSPDYVFACAGGAGGILGFFPEMTAEQLSMAWKNNFETALWSAHSAAKRMVKHGVKGKIILTSSVLGFFSMLGWSGYSSAKYAVRGLADCLRNEFHLYGLTIHCYFPGTILSPGFEAEQAGKPELTKKLEGSVSGLTPEQCAAALIKQLERGNFFITTDAVGHIARAGSKGASPFSSWIMDPFWAIVAAIILPIARRIVDGDVRKEGIALGKRSA